ncbi:Uncharacterised protein [Niallia circulans]|nr:Uncharacterised protein [Niallia circulans]
MILFKKYVWNPIKKHQKLTYLALALLLIVPPLIRFLSK